MKLVSDHLSNTVKTDSIVHHMPHVRVLAKTERQIRKKANTKLKMERM